MFCLAVLGSDTLFSVKPCSEVISSILIVCVPSLLARKHQLEPNNAGTQTIRMQLTTSLLGLLENNAIAEDL